MRSGTSCFNSPLFCKNMTRFWPLWTCYGLIWAFALPLQFFVMPTQGYTDLELSEQLSWQAQNVTGTLTVGVLLSAVFGVFAAMAVFSYLFSSRSACMVHALPLDRRGLFVTNYLSGLAFLLLPNVVIFLFTLAAEAVYGCVAITQMTAWLLVQSATALFFYSFAVFCAMFTGNILALPAFYGILNFLAWTVYELLVEVLSRFLYGSWGLGDGLENTVMWLTPAASLFRACEADRSMLHMEDGTWVNAGAAGGVRAPAAVAVYAAAGVALAVLALMVYYRRHVESAGDVVAIRVVRPVFKYGVALCSGLCLGIWTCFILNFDAELSMAAFVLLWAVAGYFVAEMLLRKSFRVWKSWKGAAVMACVLCLLFVMVELDWFGYEGRVPEVSRIQSVRLYSAPSGAPFDLAYSGGPAILDQPEQIQKIVELHQAIVDEKDRAEQAGEDSIYLGLEYTLNDGSTLRRRYNSVPVFEEERDVQGSVTQTAQALLDDRDYVRALYGLDDHGQDRLVEVYIDNIWDSNQQSYANQLYLDGFEQELWQAVLQDFEEGTIGVRYLFEYSQERNENTCVADLNFVWEKPAEQRDHVTQASQVCTTITLTPQASRTLAVLERMGVAGEEADRILTTHEQVYGNGF